MSDRPDLPAELFQAQKAVRGNPLFMRRLRDFGFNHVARRCCGHPGVARIQFHEYRDGLAYEPTSDDGTMAVILPMLGAGIEDLIAWDVRGNRIASRTGATFALGETWLSGDCESVKVFSDPASWWRACTVPPVAMMPDPQDDADMTTEQLPYSPLDRFYWHPPGLCIVDWSEARHRLGHVKQIVADCLALGEKIERAVRPLPTQSPKIYVDMPDEARAA